MSDKCMCSVLEEKADKCMCSVLEEKAAYYKKALEWTLNNFGKDITRVKTYVEFYTDQDNWDGCQILGNGDMNGDDCSGHYKHHGQHARDAMLFIDSLIGDLKSIKNLTE